MKYKIPDIDADEPHEPEPGTPDHADNPTRLTNWFPLLPQGIPRPRTIVIPDVGTLVSISAMEDGDTEARASLRAAAEKVIAAADVLGWPAFLRTDLTSMKHGWNKTCLLATRDPDSVARQIAEIHIEAECCNAAFSRALVVREMLPTVPAFTAFHGRMPVTRERRYFVRDGRMVCHHPYWPADAIKGHAPSVRNWRKALAALNDEPLDEVVELTAMSAEVSAAIPGAWSVDWLWTERGWFLIDMATAETSFHWKGCEA